MCKRVRAPSIPTIARFPTLSRTQCRPKRWLRACIPIRLRGLSGAEAQRRLAQYGPNQLKSAPETPWWKRLLEQFENFLVIILLVAIVISMIEWLLQDPRESALPYEAIVITVIVVLNALLGFFQEARAERSVRALMALAAPESTVIRDGERERVAAHEIVPGDIVLIEAGDKIPADARIIEDANLHTDEAPLTGESLPVAKSPKPVDAGASLGDRVNMLYSGTVATYGRGRAVVVATGMETEVGRIAGMLEAAEKEPTPLQQELDRTGRRLTVVMLGICAVVFAAGLFSTATLTLNVVLSLFLFAVALAVAAIPEALPAIVTVGLSLGVRRMAAAHAIVRKLPAIETLGAATVICSDKTGTLTRNEMTVRAIATGGALIDVGGSGYSPEGAFSHNGKPLAAGPRPRRRDAHAARRRAGQRCGADRERGPLEGAGRSDRGRPDRGRTQARPDRRGAGARHARRRNPLHVGAQTPHHAACRSGRCGRVHGLRQGRAGGPARPLPPCLRRRRQAGRAERGRARRVAAPQRSTRRPGACARSRSRRATSRRPRSGSIRKPPRSSCRKPSRTISCCSASSA